MAPWTTPAQRQFLESLYPEYWELFNSTNPCYKDFWAKLCKKWYATWPEIATAFPNMGLVQDLTELQRDELSKAITRRTEQLKRWFQWRADTADNLGGRRGRRTKKTISEFSRNKDSWAFKPIEKYSKMFYEEKIKPRVHELIAESSASPDSNHANSATWLTCVKQATKEFWDTETEEVKALVYETLKTEAEEKRGLLDGESSSRTPKEYLSAIQALPEYLRNQFTLVSERTGWTFCVLMGGPHPAANSDVAVATFCAGKTNLGTSYEMTPKFQELVIEPFTRFANAVYTQELRDSRKLEGHLDVSELDLGSVSATSEGDSVIPVPTVADISHTASDAKQTSYSAPFLVPVTTPPSLPATVPSAPATHPSAPSTPPSAPATHPSAPASASSALSTTLFPSAPVAAPSPPATVPSAPATHPSAPASASSALSTTLFPSAPVAAPSPPATVPSAPSTHPSAPSTPPYAPATHPSAPALSATLFPSAPVAAPTLNSAPTSAPSPSAPLTNLSAPITTSELSPSPATPEILAGTGFVFPDSTLSFLSPHATTSQLIPEVANRATTSTCGLFLPNGLAEDMYVYPSNFGSLSHRFDLQNQVPAVYDQGHLPLDAHSTEVVDNFLKNFDFTPYNNDFITPPVHPLSAPFAQLPALVNASSPLQATAQAISGLGSPSVVTFSSAADTQLSVDAEGPIPSDPAILSLPTSTVPTTLDKTAPPKLVTSNGGENCRWTSRVPIPSRRSELLNQIGKVQPTSVHHEKENVPLDVPPDWIVLARRHILTRDLGSKWVACIDAWFRLEEKLGFGSITGTKTALPATATHPEEWQKWAKLSRNGVRRYNETLFISDSAELGVAVSKWWNDMQPPFRKDSNGALITNYTAPEGTHWDPLRKSGPNGLISLMTLLAWWGQALADRTQYQTDSTAQWNETISDVTECLKAIAATTQLEWGKKRKSTATKESKAKRSRTD